MCLFSVVVLLLLGGREPGVSCARHSAELRSPDGAEPDEPVGGHGVLVRELQGDGVGGAVPWPGMGNLLQSHLRLHLHGRHHTPPRVVQLGRPQQRNVSPCFLVCFSFVLLFQLISLLLRFINS